MKTTFSLLVLLMSLSTFAQVDPAVTVSVTGRQYVATARFDHPLDTYSRCTNWSPAGMVAESKALEAAIDACEADNNLDCVHVSTTFKTILSTEFLGYKACEAQVRLRGYKVIN